jgi:hypothetical protein
MTPLSPDWAPFLRKISLFAQLGEAALTRLRDRVHPRSAPAGTVLFHQGDDSDSLIVLLAGEIRLSKIENGQDHLVTLLGRRGDTIGEMTLLNGRTRPVTARVERDAEFLVLERRDFESLLEENPAWALPLARQLSEQLVQTAPVGVDRKSAVNRTYAFFAPVPGPDRVVLGVNAALSLLEQSRRRVVVIDMAERPLDRVAPALGLRGGAAAAEWRPEDFSTPDGLRRHIERHASGLDVLTRPLSLFDARFTESFYPLLHALRRDWDHVVFLLEGDMGRLARALVAEVDRVLVAWDDPPSAAAGVLWRELEGVIPAPRLDRVELNGGDRIRRNRPGHFMIPWPRGTGQRVLGGGTPFLGPADARTHRGLDRMARHLTRRRRRVKKLVEGFRPVSSSNVDSFDGGPDGLKLRFRSNPSKVYTYPGKKKAGQKSFKVAASKGKWVWQHLRKKGEPFTTSTYGGDHEQGQTRGGDGGRFGPLPGTPQGGGKGRRQGRAGRAP